MPIAAAELLNVYDELEASLEENTDLALEDCTEELRKMAGEYLDLVEMHKDGISTVSRITGALCLNSAQRWDLDPTILFAHSGVVFSITLAVTHARMVVNNERNENDGEGI